MKNWIIKNTLFGYKYTTNKKTRDIILDYYNDYLLDVLIKKSKKEDNFIIIGGIFSNTNPSIVAISDAYNIISKISSILNVILINTDKDTRSYNNKNYSTLDLFKSIDNIKIIDNNNIIDIDNLSININNSYVSINNNTIHIPNPINFDISDNKPGILITNNGKYIFIENNFSPKHKIYEINTFDDFSNIDYKTNYIHFIINEQLLYENESLLKMNLFKYSPISIKYINNDKTTEKHTELITNFNIIDNIYNVIDDDNVKHQFDRILEISKNKL